MSFARLLNAFSAAFALLVTTACSGDESGTDAAEYRQRIEIAVNEAQARAQSPQEEWLEGRFYDIGSGFDGTVGIAVHDVTHDRTVEYNGSELFPQQSVSKLWVALTALQQAEAGKFSLDEEVTLRRADMTVFYQPIRQIVRARGSFTSDYRDLVERAIIQSDNTANDAVLRAVGGPDAVRETIVRNNLGAIRFGPGEREMQSAIAGLEWQQDYSIRNRFYEAREEVPDEIRREAFENYIADPVDGATPVAIARALGRLAEGKLLGPDLTDFYLDTLRQVRSGPNRLKGGLPPGWTIGHKTGTGQVFDPGAKGGPAEQAGYNDVGILTAPDGSHYAVAVLIARTGAPLKQRMAMMHDVVTAIAGYHDAANGNPLPETQAGESDPAS